MERIAEERGVEIGNVNKATTLALQGDCLSASASAAADDNISGIR